MTLKQFKLKQMKKDLITIAAVIAIILLSLSVKAQKSDTVFLDATKGLPVYYYADSLQKRDTVFCLMLQTYPGMQLNPVSWSIEMQSQIEMVWNRGYACIEFGNVKSYLYIDKKTKVTRKVYYTIYNP